MLVKDLSNSFNPVPKSLQKNKNNAEKTAEKSKEHLKSSKEIKKRSSKHAKLERDRDKKIVKSGKCDGCHKVFKHLDPHEVYGGSNRKRSIENGFVKMLCRKCHKDTRVLQQLKIDVQREYEKTHTREDFIKIIGKSYL